MRGVRLAVLLVTAVMNGCSAGGTDASQIKIRDGAPVKSASTGPERTGTVGIRGQTSRSSYTCSAAVLADDLLVTAGHCVAKGAEIFAYFGTDMRRATDASDYTEVTATLVNPDYNPDDEADGLPPHDIAVLKLADSIPSSHQSVPLLSPDQAIAKDSLVRLAGFGITEHGNDSDVLRYVDTTYVGTDDQDRLQIDDAAKRGACSGDSGGPLYAQVEGVWYLGGVLSGGPIPCRGVNLYTSVAAHRDFLAKAAKKLTGQGE